MGKKMWEGHHCRGCYENWLRRQRAAQAADTRNRPIAQPKPKQSVPPPVQPVRRKPTPRPPDAGCVFTKSCELPEGAFDYTLPSGFIPVESISNYGNFSILGGHQNHPDEHVPLIKVGGSELPLAMGTLLLGGTLAATAGAGVTTASASAALGTGVAAGLLTGIVAFLWPSDLSDGSLYSEQQLKTLTEARTRVRLHIEQRADGTLKGYGFNTQKRRDWEMIPVVQFNAKGSIHVADFGEGVTLTWTPSVDPAARIPPLEGSPSAPHIWIYPPTEQADKIIVNPIYPPDFQDFILVFPAESGVPPLYVVIAKPFGGDLKYHPAPKSLAAFPDAMRVRVKGQRKRWESKNRIYEWDYQHGAVEVYNRQGDHLGEFDAVTGKQTGKAKPERRTTTH